MKSLSLLADRTVSRDVYTDTLRKTCYQKGPNSLKLLQKIDLFIRLVATVLPAKSDSDVQNYQGLRIDRSLVY